MDIHRWLEETAEAEAPEKPAETAATKSLRPPQQPRHVFRAKRARQRTESDSSILAPQPHPHKAPLEAPNPPAEDETNASACSEASGCSHNATTESDPSSHCYARRPRHKTRPECYEPKRSKESTKHVHPSRKNKSKKSESRSKNKRRKKADSSAGQTFHAKNVSKDRLTLKPREQLGLFNKGKTSTAVRGRGLPDLVFSEMKFLQKEQPSPEPNVREALPKKKRRKDHVQTKEGEISAYFTTARPALAEKDNNEQSHTLPSAAGTTTRNRGQEQTQSRKSSDVVPTIEMPDQSLYLGFGSRGPRHVSTNYVSWSESVREPEVTFSRPKQPSARRLDHADSSKPNWMRQTTSNVQYTRATQTTPHMDNLMSESSAGRFRISSVVAPQPRVSRSHSHPQHSSSPRKVNLVDRAAKFRGSESIASPSTLPPLAPPGPTNERPSLEAGFITTHQGRKASYATAPKVRRQSDSAAEIARTLADGEQQVSSDFESIIRHCNYSILERHWTAEQPKNRSTMAERDANATMTGEAMLNAHREARQRPTVRFSQVEMPSPNGVSTYTGPSFYERQEANQRAALLSEEHGMDEGESDLDEQDMVYAPNAQMFDEHDWDGQVESLYDEGDMLEGFDGLDADHVTDGRVQKLPSDDDVVTRGFWRPNKLY